MQTFAILIIIGTGLNLTPSFLADANGVKYFSGANSYNECRVIVDAIKSKHLKDNIKSRVMCVNLENVVN